MIIIDIVDPDDGRRFGVACYELREDFLELVGSVRTADSTMRTSTRWDEPGGPTDGKPPEWWTSVPRDQEPALLRGLAEELAGLDPNTPWVRRLRLSASFASLGGASFAAEVALFFVLRRKGELRRDGESS